MAQAQINEFDLQVHVIARSDGTEPVSVETALAAFNPPDDSPWYHRVGGVEYEITSATASP